jgi:hypothetical protein
VYWSDADHLRSHCKFFEHHPAWPEIFGTSPHSSGSAEKAGLSPLARVLDCFGNFDAAAFVRDLRDSSVNDRTPTAGPEDIRRDGCCG